MILPAEVRARQALDQILSPYLQGETRAVVIRAIVAWETGTLRLECGDCFCQSASRPDVAYRVDASRCECPAAQQGKLCYHRWARRIALRYEELLVVIRASDTLPTHPPKPPRLNGVRRWRWDGGRLPKPKTIKQDQAAMGRHIRAALTSIPKHATIH